MSLVAVAEGDYVTVPLDEEIESDVDVALTAEQKESLIAELEVKMRAAAKAFEFEKAAQFRDRLKALKISGVHEQPGFTRVGG